MAASRSNTSRQTRAKRHRQDLVKEEASDFASKSQKSVSNFDFEELDNEEFDVLSTRRNFRRRKAKDLGPKNKHQTSISTDTKSEKIAKGKELAKEARKQGSCDNKVLDLEKKLFATFVDDGNVNEKIVSSEKEESSLVEVSRNQIDKKITETQCENKIFVNGSNIKKSIVDKSIEKLEELKGRNIDQDQFCGNRDEGIENVISHQSVVSPDSVKSTEHKKSCPVCLVSFKPSQNDNEISMHVNDCLDLITKKQENLELLGEKFSCEEPSSISNEGGCNMDEDLARELQERENAKIVEERLSSDLFFCGICQKDLNRLSAVSRQIHTNKCADFSEKENAAMRKAQRMSLKGMDKEFECLICGEMFSSILQRVAHTKKCCRQNNVDRQELLHLVREIASNNVTSSTAESTDKQLETSAKTASSLLRSGIDQIGIETRKTKKTRRKKISNEEIPLLLTRSEEEAKNMAMSKAAEIIEEQIYVQSATEISDDICMPESNVGSRYKRKINGASETLEKQANEPEDVTQSGFHEKNTLPKCAAPLWDFCDIRTSLFETQKFYVLDIFGEDLKRTIERLKEHGKVAIADDQMTSNQDNTTCIASKSDSNSMCIDANKTVEAESTPRNFADTCVRRNEKVTVLDSLEASDNAKRKVVVREIDEADCAIGNGFLGTDSNQKHSTDVKLKLNRIASRASESLISSLESLLNDEETKDMKLLCADGKVHKAHSCIMLTRCPTLRKGGNAVELTRFKYTAVKEVLKYIYTGVIDAEMEYPEEVHELANWLSLELLAEACHVLLSEHEPRMEHPSNDKDMMERSVEDLEKTLWHADTNQDLEEEEEQLQRELSGCDSPFDQSDEEDLRFYIATQREKQSSRSYLDDERRVSCQDGDIFEDKMLQDAFVEDGRSYELYRKDGCISSTVVVNEPKLRPCQTLAKSDILNSLSIDKDAQKEGLREIKSKDTQKEELHGSKVDFFPSSSDVDLDVDGASVESAQSVSVHTGCDKFTYRAVKERINRIKQNVDKSENDSLGSVCEKAVESESKLSRVAVNIPENFVDTPLADVADVRNNLEDGKECDSESGNRASTQLGSLIKSTDNGHFEDATAGLQIVDLRSPNPNFASDEEDLFDSICSGGLDMAVCLDENEDCSTVAGKQINTKEDESSSQRLNFNELHETQYNATPKPFERTIVTPNFFSSEKCDILDGSRISLVSSKFGQGVLSSKAETNIDVANRYSENGENTDRPDFNDSIADRCDSDSVESHSDSGGNKSALCYSDPISPCVTTSQFDRKGNSEGTDHFDSNEKAPAARGLPLITQRTVICLDEQDSSEDETVVPVHVREDGEENNTVPPTRQVCYDSCERDLTKAGRNQNENVNTTPIVGSVGKVIDSNEGDFKTVSVASSEEQSMQKNLVDVQQLSTSEREEGQSQTFFEGVMLLSPKKRTSAKETRCSPVDKCNDDIICLTPRKTYEVDKLGMQSRDFINESFNRTHNNWVTHDIYVDDAIADDALADITIASQRSPSPEIPMSSPEYLPSSCDKRRHYAKNKSPRSLSRKRKPSFDCELSSSDDGEANGKHPVKKSRLTTTAQKMQSTERNSCNLKSKSYACISDDDLSEEYDKESTKCSFRRSHEMECSDSSKGSESPKRQMRGGNEDGSKILYHSFVDSFDDGGFNPDIQCERFISNSCSFEGVSVTASKTEDENGKYQDEEPRSVENIVEIDSDHDMFNFDDDGGFNGDVVQDCSLGNGSTSSTENSSSVCPSMHPQRSSCVSAHLEHPEKCFSHEDSDDSKSPAICNDIVDVELTDTNTSKITSYRQKDNDEGPRKTKALAGGRAMAAQTPQGTVKAFLPGCGVHPETGLAITPMSDYDALQTPVLAKRVKQFGLRKLTKHHMAGKLREIYKMQHGFTEWEEPPAKAKRKVPKKQKAPDGKASTDNIASASIEDSDSNHDMESETNSDDERQKTFEGCYIDDVASSQVSSEADQTLSEKLMKFVLERKELYEKILTYQKLNFEEMHDLVKEAKIKCSKSKLADFLDEQCICFVVPKVDDKPRARRRRKNR